MLIRFYAVHGKDREMDIANALAAGCGDDRCEVVDAATYCEPIPGADAIAVFGLKGRSRRIIEAYRTMGVRTLLFDKGLIRPSTGYHAPAGYFRVALDGFMPLARIERQMTENISPARWLATGMKPRQRISPPSSGAIIYAGSSQKYCDFHDLGPEHEFSAQIVSRIRKVRTGRSIVYRPKPSFDDCSPIGGTIFSRPPETLAQLLPSAYALVTHGSHAAIDAIVAGVPAIVLGEGAARPVASTSVRDLAEPFFPDQERRFAWLSAIAWWQWKIGEIRSGAMWSFLREEMEIPAA